MTLSPDHNHSPRHHQLVVEGSGPTINQNLLALKYLYVSYNRIILCLCFRATIGPVSQTGLRLSQD